MKITFCGAAQEVTGSQHLLEVDGKRILLDCGLHQGRRDEARALNEVFPFDVAGLHSVILSHAHMDHSGSLPTLAKYGYRRNVYSTFATRDLCGLMLKDSARIQEQDAHFLNKKRERNEPEVKPLYAEEDADRILRQFVGFGYGHPFHVTDRVTATFYDAGHILGSAAVVLEIREPGGMRRLAFTGDLGRKKMPIIRDPSPLSDIDVLITESTYGNRCHESEQDIKALLSQHIGDTFDRGGKVIIPAFSVGRTQALVYYLRELFDESKLPTLSIYVDSPLSVNVTGVFRLHRECYDAETQKYLDDEGDPLGFGHLTYIEKVEDSMALQKLNESCVILSASGMCESGRILHHLKNTIEDEKNLILFVGYQAANTLGRRIRDGQRRVKIFGREYDVQAHVAAIEGLSAHADSNELLAYAKAAGPKAHVFVVHGEPAASRDLAETFRKENVCRNIDVPERGQVFEM